MSTKSQLISKQIKHIHQVRKDAFEEVYELLGLKYWDNDMIKKYLKGRILTQQEEIKKLDAEELKATQLTIQGTEKKP